MKRFLFALMVILTMWSLTNAQNQSTVLRDSVGKVKVTVTKGKDAKKDTRNTAVTVVGIDTTYSDSTVIDSTYVSHGNTIFSLGTDDSDFLFDHFGSIIGGEILMAIITIILSFGLPVFILFLIFFFRYKNRKVRYRLAEQALAAGQPLPEGLIKEKQPTDQRSQGIKNTFTGIGLFVFLWAITGTFGIGAIGLLVMFMGIGQWLIGYQREKKNSGYSVEEQTTKEQNEEKE